MPDYPLRSTAAAKMAAEAVLPWSYAFNRLLKKSLCGSAGSISGDVLTWIDPSFSILEPLRESFLAVHFASRV
ncbi:MAG TPA: hypothetical protein VLH56_11610, partial [Dissulfurispiraceae bacterium]|nr:hypothetical protein [Dissulfurispiraceae bacterium]